MFFVNLVTLVLLVGVLTESRVDAAKHLREQPTNLRETIVAFIDKCMEYSLNGDTDALVNLNDKEVELLIDGFPPVVGQEETKTFIELLAIRAGYINYTCNEVQPMDEGANYVYASIHFDLFNNSGEKYMDGNALDVFRKTGDEYKVYIVMFNKHNQET